MQETISDKKYSKDLNGDSVRDEYRAIPVMVYDYYPFGELMPGRSLDTAGLCVTYTKYTVVQHTNRANPGVLYGGGGSGPVSYGGAGLSASSTYSSGVTATGSSGGLEYTISGIPTYYPTLNVYFSALAGTTQVRVYRGSGTGGTQLASVNVSYASPATSIPLSGSSTGTITVVVSSVGSYASSSTSLFSIDSITYIWGSNTDVPYLYTQCGDPKDKYEFGFNGMQKDEEVKGKGNSLDFGARMYDSRLGRWLSNDPLAGKYPSESGYIFAGNSPLIFVDRDGKEKIVVVGGRDVHAADAWKFVNAGLRQAKFNERVSRLTHEKNAIILVTANMALEDIQMATNAFHVAAPNTNIVYANSSEEVINYINSGATNNADLSSQRTADKISLMDVFSHGTPGDIGLGMFSADAGKFSINMDNVDKIDGRAFAPGSWVGLETCNSTTASDKGPSIAQKLHSITKSRVSGYTGQVSYGGIYGGIRVHLFEKPSYLFDNKKTPIQPATNAPVVSPGATKNWIENE